MKRIMLLIVAALLLIPSAASAQPNYSALDPRQYDPKVDPDVDLFINHWNNAVPRVMYGHMVFRDILTSLEGEVLRPTRKGAVLVKQNAVSYATLDPGATAKGRAKAGEQQVFYVSGGSGTMTVKNKSYDIREGMGFIITPEFDFALVCTGDEQLTFYVVSEPLPDNFKVNTDLVLKNRFDGNKSTGAHWAHIGNSIIGRNDGVANYGGLGLITIDARTIPHPHSHGEGIEECWIMVKGETVLLLGKQIRRCPAGTIYKIPPTGVTAHTNINTGDKPVQMIHMMLAVSTPPKDYAQLESAMYDPAKDPDIDMFMGSWKQSMPRLMHGHLIFRDMLTALEGSDDLRPARRGACLTYSDAISYATLEPGATARNRNELKDTQQVFMVHAGSGTITSGTKTVHLEKGMTFILTPGLDFQLANNGGAQMQFYVATEKIPAGFNYNKSLEVVDNRGEAPFMSVHWANIDRMMISQKNGMCQYNGFTEVKLDAMTMAQPHSHGPGVEEIWIATDGDLELLIGKQLRRLPAGTAYRIPSTGMCAHSNINDTDGIVKLIHMMKVPGR